MGILGVFFFSAPSLFLIPPLFHFFWPQSCSTPSQFPLWPSGSHPSRFPPFDIGQFACTYFRKTHLVGCLRFFSSTAMASFLGSGSTYLSRTYEPVYDRFNDEEDEDDLRSSSDSISSESDFATLDEVGYSFTPLGGALVHSRQEKVGAIFRKTKVPHGTKIAPLGPRECGVCLTDIEPEELVQAKCGHKYCQGCLGYYLRLQSGDKATLMHWTSFIQTKERGHFLRIEPVFGVVCPHPTCNHIIEGAEFQSFSDDATWERFGLLARSLLLEELERTGEIEACSIRCGGYIQKCFCSTPKCRKREKIELGLLKELKVWAEGRARNCPKCKALIEKNGGCNHMVCTSCKTPYMWDASIMHF